MLSYRNAIVRNTKYCVGQVAATAHPRHLRRGGSVQLSHLASVPEEMSNSLVTALSALPSQNCILEDNHTLRHCKISYEVSDTNSSPQPKQDLTCEVNPERYNRGKMLTFHFI